MGKGRDGVSWILGQIEREGTSTGKRDAVAWEQQPHRGPQKTQQRDSCSFSPSAEGINKVHP